MFITELGNIEDILSFIQIMPVVPVREHLRIRIADPGLINIRDHLVARSQLGETRGLSSVFGSLLVALVPVKEAERNAHAEGSRIVRTITIIVGLKRRIGGPVCVSKLHIRVSDGDTKLRSMVIRPRRQCLLFHVLHSSSHKRWHHFAHHVKVHARLVIAQQNLQLDTRLLLIRNRIRFIRFELSKLQIEALEVQFSNISSLESLPSDIEFMPVIVQVVVCELFCGLGNNKVSKGLAHRENDLLFLGMILSISLCRGRACTIQPPPTLFSTLKQAIDASAVVVRIIGILTERDVRARDNKIRILPDAGLKLLCLYRKQVLLRRKQGWILRSR